MSNLSSIKSIVVLMMENRSFDNFIGWIYGPGNVSPNGDAFNGLTPDYWNPPSPASSEKVFVGKTTNHKNPVVDPGEVFQHINMQLFQADPAPVPLPATQGMGYFHDYANVLPKGSSVEPRVILDGFDPSIVSCTKAIAEQFAVCDQWFCSVPSQTWPNRSFAHAATSNGNINNWPYDPGMWDVETIFNRMAHRKGATWRVYYDDLFVPLTWLQMRKLQPFGYWKNFQGLDQFYDDAQRGRLPHYAFLEPSFFSNPVRGPATDAHPPHNAFIGDQFIGQIHNAIVQSPQFKANEVLFIITFDEHGGCYDHVAPFTNATPSPQKSALFDFSRFGVRVPTIVVSPFVARGSVFNVPPGVKSPGWSRYTPYDHTSILRTIEITYGFPALSKRDAAAPDLSGVLNQEARKDYEPVAIADVPASMKAELAADISEETLDTQPLNDLQISMIGALSHLVAPSAARVAGAVPRLLATRDTRAPRDLPQTVSDANEYIREKKEEFGLT